MSATNPLRRPMSAAFFAGAKTSKPINHLFPRKLNFSPFHPNPPLSFSSSNPLPIEVFSSDSISSLASNITISSRSRCGSKSLPPPLRAGGEPLSSGGESLSTAGGNDGDISAAGGLHDFVGRAGEALSMAFPLWVSLACLIALWKPPSFLWVGRTWQIVGLTLTMLGMGMTLTLDDLRAALLMPRELAAGFVLQYTVMPLSGYFVSKLLKLPSYYAAGLILVGCCPGGYFVSKLLKLPSYYAAGLILVGCCPGGTASNIVTFLARGNVALSVLMTAASTFAAAVMTPSLTSKLAGQFVAVDPGGLFISTVQVVLAPVLLGAVLNQYCNNVVKFVSPVMPLIAVATVAILCGSAIAQNASSILSSGSQVVIAVVALHTSGFFFGYVLSKLLGIDDISARTISIEVGMQNSVLGLVLASQHFGNPLTAVPCAVASICQSICGSALAGIWRSMPVETKVEG